MRRKKKQDFYEKTCEICGVEFIAEHGNKRICKDCLEVLRGKGRNLPRTYEGPADIEQYEQRLRRRNLEAFSDTIVAIGYAERQKQKTLAMAGKVNTEL